MGEFMGLKCINCINTPWCEDDRASSDNDCYQSADTIYFVDFSIGRAEMCFLSRQVGDFEVSNDEPMISTANPWSYQISTDFVPRRSNFWKIKEAKQLETQKGFQKCVFGGNPTTQISRVASDLGTTCPVFSLFSGFFLIFFFGIYFLVFFYNFLHDCPAENLTRTRA